MGTGDRTASDRNQTPSARAEANGSVAQPQARRVLIVEPEGLVCWSLRKYLAKWFTVLTADSKADACAILDTDAMDAIVVSEDLPDRSAGDIEAYARSRHPSVRVVKTVTGPPRGQTPDRSGLCLEKPFELSKLAQWLGVEDRTPGP